MNKKTYALIPIVLFLTGCMTVSDFSQMTPENRARTVCDNAIQITEIKNNISSLNRPIRIAQDNISRGYAVHENCHSVPIPEDTNTKCRQHGKTVDCKSHTRTRYETQCDEMPVAINVQMETIKLNQYKAEQNKLHLELKRVYDHCYHRAYGLSPQQSFYFYEHEQIP